MTSSNNIDYATTYFTYDPLTKIHGEPDFFKLKDLKDELRASILRHPIDIMKVMLLTVHIIVLRTI